MNNTIISALDEQFKKDCNVINLKYEYDIIIYIYLWWCKSRIRTKRK